MVLEMNEMINHSRVGSRIYNRELQDKPWEGGRADGGTEANENY